jgi:hypothetical protein
MVVIMISGFRKISHFGVHSNSLTTWQTLETLIRCFLLKCPNQGPFRFELFQLLCQN